jgi:hypothetical protein
MRALAVYFHIHFEYKHHVDCVKLAAHLFSMGYAVQVRREDNA